MSQDRIDNTPSQHAGSDDSAIPPVEAIPLRFHALLDRVHEAETRAGRPQGSVTVELAAKFQAPERVLASLNAGATLLGHNIIQQLSASEEALKAMNAPAHRVHVIGHVQKNKAQHALRYAQCIETVDDEALAARLDRLQAARIERGEAEPGSTFDVMIQVNSSGAQSQFGIDPSLVQHLAQSIAQLDHLHLIGLMTIGAHTTDESDIRRSFATTRSLRDSLIDAGFADCTQLSMGMTHDMDLAIEEGSTIIRVGTAVFGPRPTPAQ
ncbi:MAG: YggS family pyridoxal phosphate-dependent enzyme [Actinomycetaceae bacterium]|nr:YggS family pyridoxal phosphate-dependent enzyme [Actinomycetaceae bacterium]MDY6082924.1 YggS family pyridoxal phosphate-dependent enzyme [Actinomycetaceae bacterium]